MKLKAGDHALMTSGTCVDAGVVAKGTEVVIAADHDGGYGYSAIDGSHKCWEPETSFSKLNEVSMNPFNLGNILVNSGDYDYDRVVQGRIGDIVFTTDSDDRRARIESYQCLQEDDWKLKTEDEVTELTLDQIAAKFDIDVSKLRVKKED